MDERTHEALKSTSTGGLRAEFQKVIEGQIEKELCVNKGG